MKRSPICDCPWEPVRSDTVVGPEIPENGSGPPSSLTGGSKSIRHCDVTAGAGPAFRPLLERHCAETAVGGDCVAASGNPAAVNTECLISGTK